MSANLHPLLSQMTLEEKAGLCSGLNAWQTKPVERLGVTSIIVADGPHGLRKQADITAPLGRGQSFPATCFPTAATSSCSFDRELLREIGAAIGRRGRPGAGVGGPRPRGEHQALPVVRAEL